MRVGVIAPALLVSGLRQREGAPLGRVWAGRWPRIFRTRIWNGCCSRRLWRFLPIAGPLPDWPVLHRELKRPGVTLSLLWEEYRAVHRDGYGYSRFGELYRAWKGGLAPTMRQSHVAGEKMFVDYAGATLEVIDGLTGEVRAAQIFVATLGASSYTYAEATWTQALPNWIGSHSRAFAYFGGVAAQVVPDNLKSGVVKALSVRSRDQPHLCRHGGPFPGRFHDITAAIAFLPNVLPLVQHRTSPWRDRDAHPGRRASQSNPERAGAARADPSSRPGPVIPNASFEGSHNRIPFPKPSGSTHL